MLSLNLPESVLSESLYADDLVLITETIEGLRNKYLKWKKLSKIKGLKANHGETEVMVSGNITKVGMSNSKAYPAESADLE